MGVAVASQNDWGPLDILILGALLHEPCHINVGLNARPKGPTAASLGVWGKGAVVEFLIGPITRSSATSELSLIHI